MSEEGSVRLDVDTWYPPLENVPGLTPAVYFYPINTRDVKALLQFNELNRGKPKVDIENDPIPDNLLPLADALSHFMDEHKLSEGGSFVRFTKRSPKDASLRLTGLRTVFDREFGRSSTKSLEDGIIASLIATTEVLRVHNGREVLLLFGNSLRIFGDLTLEILHRGDELTDEADFVEKIVFRPFDPRIRPQYEIRVFVHDGTVTAITQYNSFCRVEELVVHKERIGQSIIEAIAQLLTHLPFNSFVADYCVLDFDRFELLLIELNPFGRKTGACMFDWHEEADAKVLEGGPLEFRVCEKTDPDGWKNVANEVQNLLFPHFASEEEKAREAARKAEHDPGPDKKCVLL